MDLPDNSGLPFIPEVLRPQGQLVLLASLGHKDARDVVAHVVIRHALLALLQRQTVRITTAKVIANERQQRLLPQIVHFVGFLVELLLYGDLVEPAAARLVLHIFPRGLDAFLEEGQIALRCIAQLGRRDEVAEYGPKVFHIRSVRYLLDIVQPVLAAVVLYEPESPRVLQRPFDVRVESIDDNDEIPAIVALFLVTLLAFDQISQFGCAGSRRRAGFGRDLS